MPTDQVGNAASEGPSGALCRAQAPCHQAPVCEAAPLVTTWQNDPVLSGAGSATSEFQQIGHGPGQGGTRGASSPGATANGTCGGSGGLFARLLGKEGVQRGRIRVGAKLGAKIGVAH